MYNQALFAILKGRDAASFVHTLRPALLSEELSVAAITRLIHLLLLTLSHMKTQGEGVFPEGCNP
jgi:hypothetical protein